MSGKIGILFFRQPLFYKDFECIGSKCPTNCCHGWKIYWTKEEYEKLTAAECSNKLHNTIISAFKPYVNKDNYYIIQFDDNGNCPLLTETKLCGIQKELGAEYLSATCMDYPRMYIKCGTALLRTCDISCVHVMEILCNEENCMELENYRSVAMEKKQIRITSDSEIDILNHPQLKYRHELFEFFYEILSEKSRSIETSIVLGAMAAQKLDEFIKKGQHNRIPEIIKALKPQLNNPEQIEKLENAKPNLSLKANFAASLLKIINNSDFITANIFENGVLNKEKWIYGMEKFNEFFKDKPFAMRNIALNLFITLKMPFFDRTQNIFDNYRLFAAEIAVIKTLAPTVAVRYSDYNVEQLFQVATACIDRKFTHAEGELKKILDTFFELYNIKSPAYLLGLIK